MALKLLKKQEERLGKDNPELIEILNLVIASACAGKKCADTTPWLLQLLELRKKVLGPKHPHVAVSLAMLGENAEMKGDLKKARQYYEKALLIRTEVEPSLVQATKRNLVRVDKKLAQK
ncbi:MAG: tetratricopeptide repeat protein [Cyanobacteria bacterium TGS_CYA1]|nr:tetratricopeptide repeat protein [Cyanobacteria bacterium TGS_CYA1]MDX2106694.1 tetratricopeptide repeat protein [Candidatus Melainabacteria bacterium]